MALQPDKFFFLQVTFLSQYGCRSHVPGNGKMDPFLFLLRPLPSSEFVHMVLYIVCAEYGYSMLERSRIPWICCACCHKTSGGTIQRTGPTLSRAARPLGPRTWGLRWGSPSHRSPQVPGPRGRRQGRQPLNPAMPRRVVWEAKHSFSYPGARPCRRPSLKSFSLLGFSRFWGFGVGKKRVKFEDAFWRFLLGVF